MNDKTVKICMVIFALTALQGCDPFRKDKCEWFLVPEPEHRHLVDKGWVSLCARNYELGKQKCYYTAKLKFAEDVYGKTFKLSTLKIDEDTFPRKVISIQTCTPEKPLSKTPIN